MAVLVEGISVIARTQAIADHYDGGWDAFEERMPEETLCNDGQLTRLGFRSRAAAEAFIRHLEEQGLTHLQEGESVDIALVDQLQGCITKTDWLQFARVPWNKGKDRISVCWLFEGPRLDVWGIHVPSREQLLAVPVNWRFEGSLSAQGVFVPTDDAEPWQHPPG